MRHINSTDFLGSVVLALGLVTAGCADDTVVAMDTGTGSGTGSDTGTTGDGDGDGDGDCTEGTLGCACGPAADCNGGLTCIDGTCQSPTCGDGVVNGSEECDEGPANSNEGSCKLDCTVQVCGDGYVGPAEGCDDGNQINDDACTNDCALATCGDGILQMGEECDDGNMVDDDACTNVCKLPICGDAIVQAGEECDDGNGVDDDACTNACTLPVCGDGILQMGEECDDGNMIDDDACTNACLLPNCGDGIVQMGEECDDGNMVNDDACTNACNLPACGDNILQAGEQCDDGNLLDNDACLSTCVVATCGDGFVWDGQEPCDDGNMIDTDACLTGCIAASCGDNIIWDGVETCDDGNMVDLDGCNANCLITGSVIWEVTYDSGPGRCDYFYGADVASGGRIAAVGSVGKVSDPLGDCDIIVRVYESDGTLVWSDTVAVGANCDEAWGADWDPQGNLWVAGHSYNPNTLRDQWVRRYDPAGNELWTNTFGGAGQDYGYGIAIDANGRGILVGSNQNTDYDVTLNAIAANGSSAWVQTIDNGTSDFALDVMTFGNSIYVAGFLTYPGQSENGWAAEFNLQGVAQWNFAHDGPTNGQDRLGGIARANDGTLAVAGFERGATNADVWTAKLTAGGSQVWSSVYDNPLLLWADRGQEVVVDSQGYVITAGMTWNTGVNANNWDTWLRKHDVDGNEFWTEIGNGGGVDGEDVWYAIDMAENDEFVVAGGLTYDVNNCTDAVLRRYAP